MIYKCCLTFFHPPSQQLFYSLRVIVSAQVVCLCACFDSVHVCVHLCLSLVLNVHSFVCVGETEWERERDPGCQWECHPWHLKQIGVYRVFNASQPEPNTIHSRLSDSLVLSRSSSLFFPLKHNFYLQLYEVTELSGTRSWKQRGVSALQTTMTKQLIQHPSDTLTTQSEH